MQRMKRWINDHPYFSTSAVFLIIILVGWRFLYWRWDNFAYLLLVYFIVTMGIRLDDISKKIGVISTPSATSVTEEVNIISQLNEIKLSLRSLNTTLTKALEQQPAINAECDFSNPNPAAAGESKKIDKS